MKRLFSLSFLVVCGLSLPVMAQSSSLYVQAADRPSELPLARSMDPNQPVEWLSPSVARVSLTAVRMPPPRVVAIHDLITVVVRETTEADSSSSLETKKKFDQKAEITDIPKIRLLNEFLGLISATDITENPKLGISASDDYKGEGDYTRKDSFTTRITARVIDVKPNGTLVLEARKFIKSDKESMEMMLTGTARVRDIASDNTLLSTQIYDLHLEKSHTGDLRKASKKGLFTKIFETIFNF